ncbi:MAG TPA: 23S rRNA (guanosine(2251)-2'-O)-methyltransferase RlmB [Stellaceae bacterium]|jgi:23S rRNA (guanosine2251-2'-O)-methyltransferase|nr:23S rRNA (guanosine(2251)-2'-O)-methyltransferase RlmB [Stellaceae bacterium]
MVLRNQPRPPNRRPPPRPQQHAPQRPPQRSTSEPATRQPRNHPDRWLYGRHAVVAALANPARNWRRLAILAGQEEEAAPLVAGAKATWRGDGDPITSLDRVALGALLPQGAVHQGWALEADTLEQPDLDTLIDGIGHDAVVIVLDQVTDPHNVGAILRSAAAFGAAGIVVAAHNAPPISAVLAKAASGALELVPLVSVVNLARTLDRLKEAGFWCCGLDEAGDEDFAALDLGPRVGLVLGAEGGGLRRLVREHCDRLARLPTRPELPSLNVSNAAAIALYELAKRK